MPTAAVNPWWDSAPLRIASMADGCRARDHETGSPRPPSSPPARPGRRVLQASADPCRIGAADHVRQHRGTPGTPMPLNAFEVKQKEAPQAICRLLGAADTIANRYLRPTSVVAAFLHPFSCLPASYINAAPANRRALLESPRDLSPFLGGVQRHAVCPVDMFRMQRSSIRRFACSRASSAGQHGISTELGRGCERRRSGLSRRRDRVRYCGGHDRHGSRRRFG